MANLNKFSGGSVELTGTAQPSDVLKGSTFYNTDEESKLTGTLELTGNVQDYQVLDGLTYYNNNPNFKRTGTMPNRNAWSTSIDAGSSITIPEGYHNGNGKVYGLDNKNRAFTHYWDLKGYFNGAVRSFSITINRDIKELLVFINSGDRPTKDYKIWITNATGDTEYLFNDGASRTSLAKVFNVNKYVKTINCQITSNYTANLPDIISEFSIWC